MQMAESREERRRLAIMEISSSKVKDTLTLLSAITFKDYNTEMGKVVVVSQKKGGRPIFWPAAPG
jgi:hypothetical protein